MLDPQTLQTYTARTPGSRRAHARAKRTTPLGVHSNFRHYDPYPLFVSRAQGARLWDVDGNEYLDFGMGFGALLCGHAHPTIQAALAVQLDSGTIYAMSHENETRLSEALLRRYPFLDAVRLTSTGTETTMHALRLARAHTGRTGVMKVAGSYHGLHDGLMVWEADDPRNPQVMSAGVLPEAVAALHLVPFNDLDAVERLFAAHPGQIAALITEPVLMNYGLLLPEPGYLQGLVEICHAHGALLILDEVKTGAKLAPGGACQFYGVEPDIVCLAKAIGGGLPLGALGARRELMRLIEEQTVAHSGTFNGNPLSVAAGLAALTQVLTPESYPRLTRLSQALVDGYNQIIAEFDLPAYAVGVGPCGNVYFLGDTQGVPVTRRAAHFGRDHRVFQGVDERLAQAHLFEMFNQGVIPYAISMDNGEQWMVSVQHTEADIQQHLDAFAAVAPRLRQRARQLQAAG